MINFLSPVALKCPYCEERLDDHRALRVHVGNAHRDKIDEFMADHFGGRWIEVDFVTLMLRRSIADLTEDRCERCNACSSLCPISKAVEGFELRDLVSKVRSGESRELLGLDVLWICTSCLACKDACPEETSPHDIVMTLRNLSARIGYHYPRSYEAGDGTILRQGLLQQPQTVLTRQGESLSRENLRLLDPLTPSSMTKFRKALNSLSKQRVSL